MPAAKRSRIGGTLKTPAVIIEDTFKKKIVNVKNSFVVLTLENYIEQKFT